MATVVFTDVNAHEPNLSDHEAFTLVMEVAQGGLAVPAIAPRLQLVRYQRDSDLDALETFDMREDVEAYREAKAKDDGERIVASGVRRGAPE